MPETIGTPILWVGFTVFVVGVLALDLGVFHRRARAIGIQEALLWTGMWFVLALAFNCSACSGDSFHRWITTAVGSSP